MVHIIETEPSKFASYTHGACEEDVE